MREDNILIGFIKIARSKYNMLTTFEGGLVINKINYYLQKDCNGIEHVVSKDNETRKIIAVDKFEII